MVLRAVPWEFRDILRTPTHCVGYSAKEVKMKLLRWIKDILHSDPVKAVGKQKGFAGSGVDTRYAAEMEVPKKAPSFIKPTEQDQLAMDCHESMMAAARYIFALEAKLNNATDALAQIAHLTKNNPAIDQDYCKAIHKIALDAHGDATK